MNCLSAKTSRLKKKNTPKLSRADSFLIGSQTEMASRVRETPLFSFWLTFLLIVVGRKKMKIYGDESCLLLWNKTKRRNHIGNEKQERPKEKMTIEQEPDDNVTILYINISSLFSCCCRTIPSCYYVTDD